ncbi:ADP-dependent NAD(P)H-hydrate dehydratase [Leucobacter chromiireducens]|uniref:ADP-dependent (S)-NAD(P)H-hydrate dehydratase n=1 Tax=Leucobacter chromiireducens subsp. chromiireducens TaxID=660067 RepID=A0ABS1SPY7_9MICO|nr:ADP/ATP-dependent (S)-NAD(P)H-hydrate dehydratase [Leucobacter chromiireducens]MBL3690232.1 NAD(P)H-hydrate dehydratase [Leucobacter chromiireducens subsp. chromiireducens]
MIFERPPSDVAHWLRRPGARDDKYRRGVLGVRTGSALYPGAAVLGVGAAWRTGLGLLRYVPPVDDAASPWGLPSPAAAVLAAHPETVFGPAPEGARPCDAWLIGSGTDPAARAAAETAALAALLAGSAPVVVDAGALGLAAALSAAERTVAAPLILTPHAGEFTRLWQAADLGAVPAALRSPEDVAGRGVAAAELAAVLGVTVLLKGSRTIAATPHGHQFVGPEATPWLATAGTGDVLAGVLGALVAAQTEAVRQDPDLLAELGIAAAQLHDRAARIAAGGTGVQRPITAGDVVSALPAAYAELAA